MPTEHQRRFHPVDPWRSTELLFRRRHLPHLEIPAATYFVSFSCIARRELAPHARDIVISAIRCCDSESIDLDAAVVMPDHAHLIFRLLGVWSLTQVMKRIKGRTASQINRVVHRSGPVWTQESFDHVVRHEPEWEEKLEYLRQNPVRRGLVTSPEQYRWLYIRAEIALTKQP